MSSRPPLRFVPPLAVLVVLAALLLAVVYVRATEFSGERAFDNILTVLGAVLAALVYGLWFFCQRGLTGRGRLKVLGVVALAVGLVVATVRIDGWTGASVPELRLVWQAPDRPALQAGTESAERVGDRPIDVVTTTPHDFPGFLGPDRNASLPNVRLARDWSATPPERVWRVDVGAGWSGFAVVNGVAFTQEQRGLDPLEAEQLVVARDVETGAELWRTAHAAHFDHMLGGAGPRATPTVAHGLVYAHDALGRLECLDGATGTLVWQHDLKALYGMTDTLEAELIAFGRSPSPLVLRDMVILPAGGDPAGKRPGLVAFHRVTGALLWEGPPRNISHASPNVATLAGVEQVLVVNADTVSGHDPRDGRLLWEHPWPGRTGADANNSQPVPVAPDKVLVSKGYRQGSMLLQLTPAEDGTFSASPIWTSKRGLRTKLTNVVLLGEHAYALSDGFLECVALATGERIWREGRYEHGQILLVGDLLLVSSEEGELSLVEATPERPNNVLGRVQAVEGKTWNTLAFYRDLVLVRNGTEAAAWRVPLAR
jgi:outer membrane protein assembly factor BamB